MNKIRILYTTFKFYKNEFQFFFLNNRNVNYFNNRKNNTKLKAIINLKFLKAILLK